MSASGTYSVEAVRVLDTHQMDLFSLIRAPNPTKVKTGSRPRAPHKLPLLTLTASRVIEMDEPAVAMDSSGVPSAIERSPLDFADEAEASGRETAAPEMPPPEEVPLTTASGAGQAVEAVVAEPPAVRESRKRGPEGVDANAPPKSLRRDHADRPSGSSRGGKSLAAMQLCLDSNVFMSEGVPADVSDPDPFAFADAPSPHHADVIRSSQGVAIAEDPGSENASSPTEVGSPESVYRPEWGVTNGSLLDTPEACQDLVDHAAPPAIGSQLRLRFEQEAKLLKKSVAQVARQDKRIQDRELEIKNLKALLETEAEMKRAAEGKNAELMRELEDIRAQFSGLKVSNEHLSQRVASLQEQVSGEEKLKASFEEFKRYEDDRVEQRCAELDARLDALSIDFDEELYPYMLTAITRRRWVIRHGLRLAMMKCAESLEMRQAFADVVSAVVAKESDTVGDAPQYIRDLRPSSSQLTIPVYPEVRDPRNPWACKEEIALADAIAANISRSSRGGKSLAAMQLCLASDVFVSEGVPADVSDPDPLAFADAPFEQEAKLLRKSVAQVARRDKRIQARELEIKNLEALLETEAETKRAAEGKNAEMMRELEDVRAQFSDLKVSNEHLSQQVAALQEQVSGEEKLKASFEKFKRYEDDRVEQRWVIRHGLRLAMMKCAESLEMRQAFADVVSAGVA
nr:hypothetical protein [Tanacetum cinerariifolium]